MHRRMVALGFSLMMLAVTACAGDEDTPVEAGSTVPSSTAPRATAPPDSPVADPATTAPPPDPGPARTVTLGEAFTLAVGESVGVTGEGLVVTYSRFVSDSRCPIGVQCITAGNATIEVDVAKADSPPAGLTLNTTEGPESAGYLGYTVTLVQLSRNASPPASLRVN